MNMFHNITSVCLRHVLLEPMTYFGILQYFIRSLLCFINNTHLIVKFMANFMVIILHKINHVFCNLIDLVVYVNTFISLIL